MKPREAAERLQQLLELDDEQVFALPGDRLEAIVTTLERVRSINLELQKFHTDQKRALDPSVQS